jgi:predicted amidohydrolase
MVCLWEYVWYNTDAEVERNLERNRQYLARIADAARRNRMYVAIAGELERGFNEAILYDRQGGELGRYTKILQTTARESKYYQEGNRVGVYDLDFGRVCLKICNDVNGPDIDRVAALHQVDLMLFPTQDAGPYSEHIRLREAHRCVDCGYFLLRAAASCEESDHRSYIMDPWGMVLAGSQPWVDNPPLIATLNLDNRPRYYTWPDEVRRGGDLPDPAKRGIPAKEGLKMYGRFNRPVAGGDLRAVVLSCRRPELYRPRPEK